MEFIEDTINRMLLFGMLAIVTSCMGQNLADSRTLTKKNKEVVTIGNPVSEMDSNIVIVFQDKHDIYWFGSRRQGVYRYDGRSITQYTTRDGLPSNTIVGIQEDNFGNIYFDTQEGVSRFDGLEIITLKVTERDSTINKWKLEPDDLWFRMGGGKNGPYRYDGKLLYHLEFPKSGQADAFYLTYPNASYSPYAIYTIYKDKRGAMWFGTGSLGLCRYDGKSLCWLYEKHLTETPSGGSFGIRSIIEDKEGFFWFCNTRFQYEILQSCLTENGINQLRYKRKNGIGKPDQNNEDDFPYFMSITEDNEGDLWMATYDDGVWRKRVGQHDELIHYPIKDRDTDVLLFSTYLDNKGVLWLGSHNNGVYKLVGDVFEKFQPEIIND